MEEEEEENAESIFRGCFFNLLIELRIGVKFLRAWGGRDCDECVCGVIFRAEEKRRTDSQFVEGFLELHALDIGVLGFLRELGRERMLVWRGGSEQGRWEQLGVRTAHFHPMLFLSFLACGL